MMLSETPQLAQSYCNSYCNSTLNSTLNSVISNQSHQLFATLLHALVEVCSYKWTPTLSTKTVFKQEFSLTSHWLLSLSPVTSLVAMKFSLITTTLVLLTVGSALPAPADNAPYACHKTCGEMILDSRKCASGNSWNRDCLCDPEPPFSTPWTPVSSVEPLCGTTMAAIWSLLWLSVDSQQSLIRWCSS